MTEPAARRSHQPGGQDRLLYIDLRWPQLAAGTSRHYAELRQRLDAYTSHLTADIDQKSSDHR